MDTVCVDRKDLRAVVNELIRLHVSERAQTAILNTQQYVNRYATQEYLEALREEKPKAYDTVRFHTVEILTAFETGEQIGEALARFIKPERDKQDRLNLSGESLFF